MSNIAEIKMNRFNEIENKKYNRKVKEIRTQHNQVYLKEVKKNETTLTRMRSGYETKIKNLKAELDVKLIGIRKRQTDTLKSENKRLDEEVSNLKIVHTDQVEEIKTSQSNEIRRITDSHKETLDTAQRKYTEEKKRMEASS